MKANGHALVRALVPVAGVLLLAGGAQAQAEVLGTAQPTGGYTFNVGSCSDNETVNVRYDIPYTGTVYWSLQITEPQGTNNNCPRFGDQDPAFIVEPFTASPTPGGELVHDQDYLPSELLGPICDETPRRENFPLCIYMSQNIENPMVAADVDTVSLPIPISVDTIPPDVPQIQSIKEGQGQLQLIVGGLDDSEGDNYSFDIQFRACAALADAGSIPASAVDGGVTTGGSGSTVEDPESLCDAPGPYSVMNFTTLEITLDNLVNEVRYEVRAVAVDDFNNVSEPSVAQLATPRNELTPLDFYNGNGSPVSVIGPDCEACTQGSTTTMASIVGFWFWARRRRRRQARPKVARRGQRRAGTIWGGFLALAIGLSAAGQAQAYIGQLTVGMKGSLYKPDIDSEVIGSPGNQQKIYPIYKCFFEQGGLFPAGWLPQPGVDLDVHVFDAFGSLELGMGLNFTQAVGTAVPVGEGGAALISTGTCPTERGTSSIELTVAMAKPQMTYRFDPLLDYFGVPFVPYGRVGLVAAGYAWTQNGSFDNDHTMRGINPIGVRFGAEAALGMMFALDWFDLRNVLDAINHAVTTRELTLKGLVQSGKRRTSLLEHSYVFAEVSGAKINNFWTPGFDFSPRTDVNLPEPWRLPNGPLSGAWPFALYTAPIQFQVGMAAELF